MGDWEDREDLENWEDWKEWEDWQDWEDWDIGDLGLKGWPANPILPNIHKKGNFVKVVWAFDLLFAIGLPKPGVKNKTTTLQKAP